MSVTSAKRKKLIRKAARWVEAEFREIATANRVEIKPWYASIIVPDIEKIAAHYAKTGRMRMKPLQSEPVSKVNKAFWDKMVLKLFPLES